MLIFGLVLIVVAALLIVSAVFTADANLGNVELLGIGMSPSALFLVGLFAGIAIMLGLAITKFGFGRSVKERKEKRKLNKLSVQLDEVEAERRKDLDDNDR